jgi:nucleoside-diphosphate-sugar epimerase
LFVRDAAEAVILATERYDEPEPVNIGSGTEISIKHLAETVCSLTRFQGELRWDVSKPNGQPRRMLDTSRADRCFGFRASTTFERGLEETVAWYEKRHLANRALVAPL